MIRLKSLLAEISLSTVQPYATQFTWRQSMHGGEPAFGAYESQFQADSQLILAQMVRSSGPGPYGPEWSFGYSVRTSDSIPGRIPNWTVSAGMSAARGETNVLRLLKTVGYAIRDFADTHSDVDVINITGYDSAGDAKSMQKTRIYRELLAANPELSQFRVWTDARGELWLIRKNLNSAQADASGIDTPGDPTM